MTATIDRPPRLASESAAPTPRTLMTLVAQRFRRDRVQIAAWIAGFALLAYVGNAAVESTYGTEAQRVEVLKLVQSTPAVLMLRGTPQGPAADAFQFFLLFAFLGVLSTAALPT